MRSSFKASALLLAISIALPACLYTDVRAPLSYGSATPGDANGSLGREVKGKACNHGILWLVAFGDGGYDAAVRDARGNTNAMFLVDVKADTTYKNILFGLYQRQCTEISARIPGPTPAASGSAAP
jgi:hypothetical protein